MITVILAKANVSHESLLVEDVQTVQVVSVEMIFVHRLVIEDFLIVYAPALDKQPVTSWVQDIAVTPMKQECSVYPLLENVHLSQRVQRMEIASPAHFVMNDQPVKQGVQMIRVVPKDNCVKDFGVVLRVMLEGCVQEKRSVKLMVDAKCQMAVKPVETVTWQKPTAMSMHNAVSQDVRWNRIAGMRQRSA